MSGEDELRRLDEDFRAGRLSAEDYRQRRDGLLSQSGGGQGQRPDPFPPAFRWETAESSETTQYITPIPGGGNSATPDTRFEQTQVIRSDAPEPAGDSDTTQVVSAQPPRPAPPDLAAPPRNQGWTNYPPAGPQDQGPRAPAPNDTTTPPWATMDVADPGGIGWGPSSYQEPDAFETESAPGKGRIFAIIGAVVLIAALVTGTVLFLTLDSAPPADTPATAAPPTAAAPAEPTTPPPPEPFGPLVVPSGTGARTMAYSPTELDDLSPNPLPPADLIVLKQAGIAGARSVIVDDNATTTSLWSFTASRNAAALYEALDTDQRRFGFVRSPQGGPAGLPVYTSEQETSAGRAIIVFRAHYVSGRDVIRVDTYADDAGTARERFDAVLADQLEHNRPT